MNDPGGVGVVCLLALREIAAWELGIVAGGEIECGVARGYFGVGEL